MNRKVFGIIGGVAVVALLVVAIALIINNNPSGPEQFKYRDIIEIFSSTDYSDVNPDSIVEPTSLTGDLPEKVIGSADAPVVIYEYADYACSHCAEMNTYVKKLIEEYNGEVAVVYRGYLLNGYPNNVIAAAAANAAAIQGYWDKYRNLVFSDQATWFYLKGDKVVPYFGDLFVQASDGKGDLDKFYEDMMSESVGKRMAFEYAMGEKVELTGTPTFRINGEKVSGDKLKDTIDELLAE